MQKKLITPFNCRKIICVLTVMISSLLGASLSFAQNEGNFAVECGRYTIIFDRAAGIAKQIKPTVENYRISEWNNEVIKFGYGRQLNRYTGTLHGNGTYKCARIPIPRPQF